MGHLSQLDNKLCFEYRSQLLTLCITKKLTEQQLLATTKSTSQHTSIVNNAEV